MSSLLMSASGLSKLLAPGDVVAFFGDLGVGKTTFIKELAHELNGVDKSEVTSPTFVTLNIYDGHPPIYHFDLYRLENSRDFLAQGFDEYFDAGGICCIEWSERIEDLLPERTIRVFMSHKGENERDIRIEKSDL